MKKYIFILIIIGITVSAAMLLFFDLTVPQLLLNIACVVILISYLITKLLRSKKNVIPKNEVKQ